MSQLKSKTNSVQLPPTFSVNIGGIPYKVSYVPWKEVDHDGRGERLFGQIDYMKHSIHLASDMPKEKQQLGLLHEVIHAIINEYNIREMMSESKEHSEYAIDHLSLGLLSFLNSINLELPYHHDN